MPPFIQRAIPTLIGLAVLAGIVGAWLLYRALSSNDVGELCGDNDCNGIMGEYCIHDGLDSYCSPSCESTGDCPSGWVCEHPTQIDSNGGEHYGVVQFCMRPRFQAVVLRSGTGTVSEFQGALSNVAVNTACNWQQLSAPPETGFDTQWTVDCGGVVLYGGTEGGFNPSTDSSWPAGFWVHDASTTIADGDPSFIFDGTTIRVRDDASGSIGAFQVVINVSP